MRAHDGDIAAEDVRPSGGVGKLGEHGGDPDVGRGEADGRENEAGDAARDLEKRGAEIEFAAFEMADSGGTADEETPDDPAEAHEPPQEAGEHEGGDQTDAGAPQDQRQAPLFETGEAKCFEILEHFVCGFLDGGAGVRIDIGFDQGEEQTFA